MPKNAPITVSLELAATADRPGTHRRRRSLSRPVRVTDVRVAFSGFSIDGMPPGDIVMRAIVSVGGKPVGRAIRTLRKSKWYRLRHRLAADGSRFPRRLPWHSSIRISRLRSGSLRFRRHQAAQPRSALETRHGCCRHRSRARRHEEDRRLVAEQRHVSVRLLEKNLTLTVARHAETALIADPAEQVVVLMLEGHSVDHVLGSLRTQFPTLEPVHASGAAALPLPTREPALIPSLGTRAGTCPPRRPRQGPPSSRKTRSWRTCGRRSRGYRRRTARRRRMRAR